LSLQNVGMVWRLQKLVRKKKLTVYLDGYLKAYEMYNVEMHVLGWKPLLLGTLDCTQKIGHFVIPEIVLNVEDFMPATIKVVETEPLLAWKTSGKKFEDFMDEITDEWRKNVMLMVKEGIANKNLDPNQKVGNKELFPVFKCLYKHIQSPQLQNEFEDCFKKITL